MSGLAPQLKQLSEKDRKALGGYLIRVKMGEAFGGKGMPPGTTVGDALKQQKEWVVAQEQKDAEAAALKAKLAAEKAAAVEKLNKVITVTLLSKEQRPKDFEAHRYSETQVFHIGVQNNSD